MVKHYSAAVQEFSNVYLELDKVKTKTAPTVDPEKLGDDLETWLNVMRLEDGTSRPSVVDLSKHSNLILSTLRFIDALGAAIHQLY